MGIFSGLLGNASKKDNGKVERRFSVKTIKSRTRT